MKRRLIPFADSPLRKRDVTLAAAFAAEVLSYEEHAVTIADVLLWSSDCQVTNANAAALPSSKEYGMEG